MPPIRLIPTEGCYQKTLCGVLARETPSRYYVKVDGECFLREFSKKTLLHSSPEYRKFPNYRLDFEVAL